MVELRWLVSHRNDYERVLQFRVKTPHPFGDAPDIWSEWENVPDVIWTKEDSEKPTTTQKFKLNHYQPLPLVDMGTTG